MRKLILIDGSSLTHRAFNATSKKTKDEGSSKCSVKESFRILKKLLNNYIKLGEVKNGEHIFVAFEGMVMNGKKRVFKKSRITELYNLFQKYLDQKGISWMRIDNYKADDIIGTLSKKAEKIDMNVHIFSYDKDYIPLACNSKSIILNQIIGDGTTKTFTKEDESKKKLKIKCNIKELERIDVLLLTEKSERNSKMKIEFTSLTRLSV